MPCVLINKSKKDLSNLVPLVKEFFPYAKEKMGFDKGVTVILQSDVENSKNPLGKTAYYNPDSFTVVLYVDGRHPKDILRSFSHELVHHSQNCNGKFNSDMKMGPGYAQEDGHLRNMEEDAYRRGNLTFRDWEDEKKKRMHSEGLNLIVKDVLQEYFLTTYK